VQTDARRCPLGTMPDTLPVCVVPRRLRRLRPFLTAALNAVALLSPMVAAVPTASCGSSGRTSPTPVEPTVAALSVECQPSLIVGEARPCVAVARMADGRLPFVSPIASWSSARPQFVAVSPIGDVKGVAAGDSQITVSYGGRQAVTTVSVSADDAVKLTALSEQGTFTPGSTVSMSVQGFYALQSADTATLQMLVVDRRGATIVGPANRVERGGNAFNLTVGFQVPNASEVLCRSVRMTISSAVRIEEPGAPDDRFCTAVRR
jgi:hypothetical protein